MRIFSKRCLHLAGKAAGLTAILLVTGTACSPIPDYRPLSDRTMSPPLFLGIDTVSPTEVAMLFNKEPIPDENAFHLAPDGTITGFQVDSGRLMLSLDRDMTPGKEYAVSARIKDEWGNSVSIISRFYGHNPHIPEIIINEFTTTNSTGSPERVELRVFSAGSLAGLTVYEGTKGNWNQRKILPPVEVEPGDYIIVHFRPRVTEDEIDELYEKDECTARNSHPEAWDFWLEGGSGISTNNGVLTLYASPHGALLDGILYSNRTSASDERYRGFGTARVLERADELHSGGGWSAAGELIAPEDGINPDPATATRSINRSSDGTDTNTAADWHIVPTGGATFGEVNNDEIYQP